jgi:hypothetical protein
MVRPAGPGPNSTANNPPVPQQPTPSPGPTPSPAPDENPNDQPQPGSQESSGPQGPAQPAAGDKIIGADDDPNGGASWDVPQDGGEPLPGLYEGYWTEVGKGLKGFFWNAPKNALLGMGSILRHPINTLQGIGTAIRHPILTAQAIGDEIGQKATSGTEGQAELVGDVAMSVLGNKLNATVLAKLKQLKLPSIGACFPTDTPVASEAGFRPIAQIEAGERVWAYDFPAGVWRLGEVECRSDAHYEGRLVTLRIGAVEVTATADHPFWVIEGPELEKRPALGHLDVSADRGESLPGRWVNSQDLRAGDVLYQREGGPVTVSRIRHRQESLLVCNLTIRKLHTFSVGAAQLLVHNSSGSTGRSAGPGAAAARRMQVAEALENGAINQTARRAAGVTRPPHHHIFPQQYKDWFKARGVDIDRYTLPLDEGTHGALHYGGGPGKGGGFWNNEIMSRLMNQEAALGRQLTPREILQIGAQMRRQYAPGTKLVPFRAP